MAAAAAAEVAAAAAVAVRFVPTHVRQSHNWDCGLACISAVLHGLQLADDGRWLPAAAATAVVPPVAAAAVAAPAAAPDASPAASSSAPTAAPPLETAAGTPVMPALVAGVGTRSIWSADLLLLCARLHLPRLAFHSTLLAVNPEYAGLAYYAGSLADDTTRVAGAFAAAAAGGVAMHQHHLPSSYFCDRLAAGAAVFIVLVDLRYLKCSKCWLKTPLFTTSYSGHYIVLLSYDPVTDAICYMDPATDAACCFMTPAQFDTARTATGTDEDAIEISLLRTTPLPT